MHSSCPPYLPNTDVQKREKLSISDDINSIDVSQLHPPLDENALVKELVAQFLAHDGYVKSAKAFAEEVQAENGTLKSGAASFLDNFSVEDDIDAVNRQRNLSPCLVGLEVLILG